MPDEESPGDFTRQKNDRKKEEAEKFEDEDDLDEDEADDENRDEEDDDDDEAEDDITRINFTVPKRMKVKWQDMAKNMATSISQLIRTAVQAYGRDVEQDLKRASEEIERAGQEMEKAGQEMERMFHGKGRPGGDDPSLERRPSGAGASRADAVGSGYPVDPLDQLRKLKELLDMGAITDEEYKEKKTKLLDMV